MKLENKIDIFIDGSAKSNEFGHRLNYNSNWISVSSTEHIHELLRKLKDGTKVSFWIHVGNMDNMTEGKLEAKETMGEVIQKKFEAEFPNIHFEFLTRAGTPLNEIGGKHLLRTGDLHAFANEGKVKYHTSPIIIVPQSKTKTYSLKDERDLDSRIIENFLGKGMIETFVGELLDDHHNDVQVSVLEPGFSGAFVLLFEYQDGGDKVKWVIKINESIDLIDIEKEASTEIKSYLEPKNSFITSISNKSKRIGNWSCLVFHFLVDQVQLRQFLINKISTLSDQEAEKLSSRLLEDFSDLRRGTKTIKGKLWSGISQDLNDDNFKLELSLAKKIQFTKFLKDSSLLLNSILKDPNILPNILEFMEKSTFNGTPIEPTDSLISLSRVHGDFHSGNIFLDTDTKEFSFIDLSHFKKEPSKSSFLDIGKLTVDIELTATKNLEFFNDKSNIFKFSQSHLKWLSRESFAEEKYHYIFHLNEGLYQVQLEQIINADNQLSENDLWPQFLKVRLHYFIKHCTYTNISFEKKIYAINAIHQTLKALSSNF